jgi:hypothetical protein
VFIGLTRLLLRAWLTRLPNWTQEPMMANESPNKWWLEPRQSSEQWPLDSLINYVDVNNTRLWLASSSRSSLGLLLPCCRRCKHWNTSSSLAVAQQGQLVQWPKEGVELDYKAADAAQEMGFEEGDNFGDDYSMTFLVTSDKLMRSLDAIHISIMTLHWYTFTTVGVWLPRHGLLHFISYSVLPVGYLLY